MFWQLPTGHLPCNMTSQTETKILVEIGSIKTMMLEKFDNNDKGHEMLMKSIEKIGDDVSKNTEFRIENKALIGKTIADVKKNTTYRITNEPKNKTASAIKLGAIMSAIGGAMSYLVTHLLR